jgi:hypothetical protein
MPGSSNSTRLELLKREQDLENNLYNGTFTLAHFLDDIRIGDIVEYACSFVGEEPVFPSHFAGAIVLADHIATEKVHRRILAHPSRPLSFRAINTQAEAKMNDLSPNLRDWVWEVFSTESIPREHGGAFMA